MSVKGCYTDFHIDFGGTSVWYHVFKGRKVSSSLQVFLSLNLNDKTLMSPAMLYGRKCILYFRMH